jgi:excisionase family DNA binding protein
MLNSEKQTVLEETESRQPIPPRWLKVQVAVKYSGISRSALYVLLTNGKIRSHRIGAARVIDRESLDAFITSQPA